MKRVVVGLFLLAALAGLARAETLDVLSTKVDHDARSGAYGVVVRLSGPAGETIKRLTTENVGRNMSIELDGKAIWLPRIADPITNGYFLISNLDKDLAERMASDIRKSGSIGVTVLVPPGG